MARELQRPEIPVRTYLVQEFEDGRARVITLEATDVSATLTASGVSKLEVSGLVHFVCAEPTLRGAFDRMMRDSVIAMLKEVK